MKNNKLSTWSKFQTKSYDIKFIWYSLFFTLIAILLAAIANYLWFKLNGGHEALKLDGQTFVGVFALAIGLPIAIVGAWAAIRIATLAQDTQDRQHALETKLFLIELTNPIKNNFIDLVQSLNGLVESSALVKEASLHILKPIINEKSREYREGVNPSFNESDIQITEDKKQALINAENLLFEKYDDLLVKLSAIQSDSKSSAFWKWKLTKDREHILNRGKIRLTNFLGVSNENEFSSYLKTGEGISHLITCCKLLKKHEKTNYLQLSNHEILNQLKCTHSHYLVYPQPPRFAYEDRGLEVTFDSISECNNVISRIISYSDIDGIFNVRLLSDLLLIIIMILPTEFDVDSFLYDGPFMDVIGQKSPLSSFLYDFDASSFLNIELKEIKLKLSNSPSYYFEAFNRLEIFPTEQEELEIKEAYNTHLKEMQNAINRRYAASVASM